MNAYAQWVIVSVSSSIRILMKLTLTPSILQIVTMLIGWAMYLAEYGKAEHNYVERNEKYVVNANSYMHVLH